MKLKSKLKLYEEFVNESTKETTTTTDSVAIDQVSVDAAADSAEAVRTEVIRDVDTILNNLAELSDRIGESDSITLEMDELFEELFELTNVTELNEGILDFIKSPIKFMKIKKNLKSYQKALVQKSINDVDFAKKKQAGDADEKDKKRMETLKQANEAKNKALDDQIAAIGERMTELSKGDEGLGKVVSIGKTKSKLAAAKIVMKATSGEEAKQLKLEIDTLENRIADDEKSLKDYAKKEGPADHTEDDQSDDDNNPTSKDQMDGVGEDGKDKKKIEKLEGAKTKAKEKYDAVDASNVIEKAKANLEFVKVQLELAKLKEDDAEVIKGFEAEIKSLTVTASRKPAQAPAGPEEETETGKTPPPLPKEEETETGKTPPPLPKSAKKENASEEPITGEKINEASLGELMSMSDDDYAYLKGEAKKLGVKVSVSTGDDSMYADMGYDTLSFSGDKAAILKLAKISGHDADICPGDEDCGGYILKEANESVEVEEGNEFGAARAEAIAKGEKTFKVGDEEYPVEDVSKEDEENAEEFVEEAKEELPKTIKLDEGLTIAQRFSRLM